MAITELFLDIIVKKIDKITSKDKTTNDILSSLKQINLKELLLKNCITSPNLLPNAQNLKDYYDKNHAFPKIMIIDVLRKIGQTLNSFLYQLEDKIRMNESKEEKKERQQTLINSVFIKEIFCLFELPILFNRYCDHQEAFEKLKEKIVFNIFSFEFQDLVNECG